MVSRIFVCHDSRLVDRRKRLEEDFAKCSLPYAVEWIELFDTKSIQAEFDEGKSKGTILPQITIREYSLYLKHFHCYELASIEKGMSVIFEDDVVIPSNLSEVLNMVEASGNDFVFLSDRTFRNNKRGYVYDLKRCALVPTRMNVFTHAQVVSPKAYSKLFKFEIPCSNPIDLHLLEVLPKSGLRHVCLTPGFDQDKTSPSSLRDGRVLKNEL